MTTIDREVREVRDLNWYLDYVQVEHRDESEDNAWWPEDLPWAVTDGDGLIGLFVHRVCAFQYRLTVINEKLNHGWA
jgi:hypothetical protein